MSVSKGWGRSVTPGGRTKVSFLTGPLVDVTLSRQIRKIYWYVDDQFINGGAGLQNVAFSAPGISGNTMDVRVEVPSYKSALKTIEIPVVDPEAVITSPFPSNQFSATPITLNGWPFFFNAKNASNIMTSWSVNGVVSGNAEDPGTLTVNLNPDAPSGSNLAIGITMGTPGSRLGFGAKTINLTLIR